MDYINLFGLKLEVQGDGRILNPNLSHIIGEPTLGSFDGRTQAFFDTLLFIGEMHSLRLRLTVQLYARTAGEWYPLSGFRHPQTQPELQIWDGITPRPPFNLPMFLRSGALRLVSPTFPQNNGILGENDNLTFIMAGQKVVDPAGMPVGLTTGGGGFSLDLKSAKISFRPGFITATTGCPLDTETNGRPTSTSNFFERSLASAGADSSLLLSTLDNLVFVFPQERDEDFLPLHASLYRPGQAMSKTNPVIVPLAANGYQLRLGIRAQRVGGLLRGTLINHASLGPKAAAAKYQLHSHAYGNALNQQAIWMTASPLELRMRTGTRRRPATFMIAPAYKLDLKDNVKTTPVELELSEQAAIHGMIPRSRFSPQTGGRLVCEVEEGTRPAAVAADPGIVTELTVPWIFFNGANTFEYPKPGDSNLPGEAEKGQAETFSFHGTEMALPLLPPEIMKGSPSAERLLAEHYKSLNKYYSSHSYELRPAHHETWIREQPVKVGGVISPESTVKPSAVFKPPSPQASLNKPTFKQHKVIRDLDRVKVYTTIKEGKEPEYIILKDGDKDNYIITEPSGFNFALDPDSGARLGGERPAKAILKLGRQYSLRRIFEIENFPTRIDNHPDKSVLDVIDPGILNDENWTGLIMFTLPINYEQVAGLNEWLTGVKIPLAYLAINSPKPGRNDFSITGRLLWKNPATLQDPNAPATEDSETIFRVDEIDAAWSDTEINFFHLDASLYFPRFFGIPRPDPMSRPLKIIATYDKVNKKYTYVGRITEPFLLLPELEYGPIRQARVESVEVRRMENGQMAFALNGSLELRSIDFNSYEFRAAEGNKISFTGLQIRRGAGQDKEGKGSWLTIDYPAIELKFNTPSFNFGFFEMKVNSLWVDWGTGGANQNFPWQDLVTVYRSTFLERRGVSFVFSLRLELMKLPELARKSIDRLIVDFYVGLKLDTREPLSRIWSRDRMIVALRAVSFEKLRLDLLRFLELKCEKAELAKEGGVIGLTLVDVSLRILEKNIISGLSAFLFSAPGGKRGFIAFLPFGAKDDLPTEPQGGGGGFPPGGIPLPPVGPATPGLPTPSEGKMLEIYWVLVGHNISLPRPSSSPGESLDLIKAIMSVDAPNQNKDNALIRNSINKTLREKKYIPETGDGGSVHGGGWLFAAGFNFFGLFQCKLLFQDHAYYGLCLRGEVFDKWFGKGFAFSVIYIKGERPQEDTFIVSVRVPQVITGSFTFLGGVVTLEVAMNGDFTLDVGFPWLLSTGERLWNRTMGVIVYPFQGMGGFYIRKHHLHSQLCPAGTDRCEGLRISGGYAVEFGLGAASGNDVYRVWATVGIYAILEGAVFLERGKGLQGLQLVGANGILVRGAGELNWWIISARVEVMLSAEARTTLDWGFMEPGHPTSDRRARLTIDFLLYAKAEAHACIGKGFFKVCGGIDVSVPLRFNYSLDL